MNKLLLAPLLALALLPLTAAAKQAPQHTLALTPPLPLEADAYSADGRRAQPSGRRIALYSLNVPVLPSTPEAMARQFLAQQASVLQLADPDLSDLEHVGTRTSRAGHNVQFQQSADGVPVYDARLVVHISPGNRVTQVANGYRPLQLASTQPLVSAAQAREALIARIGAQAPFGFDQTQLTAYPAFDSARLAWRVRLSPRRPVGSWEALVDARDGTVFVLWDRAAYASRGQVFDPDPLSSSGTKYGAAISDREDADYEAINKEIVQVDLGELDFSGGFYTLSNDWAEIVDHEAPFLGLHEQQQPDFLFAREANGFEAATTFFHIQESMRYINHELGIALRPHQYRGGVQFDPQGLDGADNSHYDGSTGQLAFGEGCVDDDEDADVIRHELAHGLHDWVTNGGLSNMVDGLSEGFADYWAQSYSRSLGQWGTADPEYQWVFNWDGHNECWAGRVTNVAEPYPALVQPGITVHAGGQHWSTCTMKIYDQIGRARTDTMLLEGLAMTHGFSSQNDAANAVLQAAADLGATAGELDLMSETFTGCGYVMGAPAIPALPAVVPSKAQSNFGGALPAGLLGALLLMLGLRRR